MDTVTSLVEEYFAALRAPCKKLFLFENSGHMAPFEEPARFYP